jgi:hypothetical protein
VFNVKPIYRTTPGGADMDMDIDPLEEEKEKLQTEEQVTLYPSMHA